MLTSHIAQQSYREDVARVAGEAVQLASISPHRRLPSAQTRPISNSELDVLAIRRYYERRAAYIF